MKIGIMGGTFNPIHNGHIMLAKTAKETYHLDKVWFMPNGKPPHKSAAFVQESALDRLQMVSLAIKDIDGFEVQDYEMTRNEISYSYRTMEYFKETYKNDEFYFIIGADSLFSIEKWVHPERLFQTCILLVAYREGEKKSDLLKEINRLNQKYGSKIEYFSSPRVDISSTDIRYRVKYKKNIQDLVPSRVYQYIKKNHLFGGSNRG